MAPDRKTSVRFLPGDPSPRQMLHRMIRVDHAGEYGAMRIYEGQLAVLRDPRSISVTRQMASQEKHHLETFETLMRQHRVRPTVLMPLWHMAGFALGAATALMGKEAAMACTAAVESVIDEHYAAQQQNLAGVDAELAGVIGQFRQEEKEHHDTALAEGADKAPLYPLLHGAIRQATKIAIFLSTRL